MASNSLNTDDARLRQFVTQHLPACRAGTGAKLLSKRHKPPRASFFVSCERKVAFRRRRVLYHGHYRKIDRFDQYWTKSGGSHSIESMTLYQPIFARCTRSCSGPIALSGLKPSDIQQFVGATFFALSGGDVTLTLSAAPPRVTHWDYGLER
jgi:hypothetical protein